MKKLNLNICVSPVCRYHHPPHPQPMLKSSFEPLMVFHKLNEINYFHILQTLQPCALPLPPLPSPRTCTISSVHLYCKWAGPDGARGLPGLLFPGSGEENPAEEWSKASFSGKQMLSKHGEGAPVTVPSLFPLLAFIIFGVCWLALMKPHVIFIQFPVFTSSLGFRIVVDLISRGGRSWLWRFFNFHQPGLLHLFTCLSWSHTIHRPLFAYWIV